MSLDIEDEEEAPFYLNMEVLDPQTGFLFNSSLCDVSFVSIHEICVSNLLIFLKIYENVNHTTEIAHYKGASQNYVDMEG